MVLVATAVAAVVDFGIPPPTIPTFILPPLLVLHFASPKEGLQLLLRQSDAIQQKLMLPNQK